MLGAFNSPTVDKANKDPKIPPLICPIKYILATEKDNPPFLPTNPKYFNSYLK